MNKIIIYIFCVLIGTSQSAVAFWGNSSNENSSGLDLVGGYDTNTVATVHGTVVSPPAKRDGSEHTEMVVVTPQGTVTILLGPWSFWSRQEFTAVKGQEISIIGSRAVGKDGAMYLFAQKLETRGAAPAALTLRSESGIPAWSRGGSGMGNGAGSGAGRNNGNSSPGYRGGGMRGGGRR